MDTNEKELPPQHLSVPKHTHVLHLVTIFQSVSRNDISKLRPVFSVTGQTSAAR